MAKSIVVAGDLVRQENLVQRIARESAQTEAAPLTALHSWIGGAARLASLVRIACSDIDIAAPEPDSNRTAGRSYALWTLHEQTAGSRQRVWRIRELLGVQPADHKASSTGASAGEAKPDLLILDDQNLGFRDDTESWPAALREGGNPRHIIVRTRAPLAEGLLWKRLLQAYADRVDVVLPVSALRARGASISQSLSWDRTIEDTAKEFETGACSGDLALMRRVVVHFGSAGAASFTRSADGSTGKSEQARAGFERFLYHPDDQETNWESRHPGLTLDDSAILAASLARHEAAPQSYPLFIALGRGLAAMRAAHEQGGGPADKFSPDAADQAMAQTLHPAAGNEPAAIFYTAFPHRVLDSPANEQSPSKSDLLRDAIGSGVENVAAKGIDICQRGLEAAMPAVPKCRYGHFLTVDREEMERLNAIRNLIVAYRANPREQKPLSFAVFGPPGCGKSFAVKELAAELFAGQLFTFEFNLSQFEQTEDLHQAFHRIRDGSVHGQIPFVFWDEFDSLNLKWLKEFLAPMQDAVFRSKGIQFPFGKVIFVFAGGTASSLAEFDRGSPDKPGNDEFRAAKGPDFVSRLRGFIDIKGPNPAGARTGDLSHIIRRAIMLRSSISRLYPQLLDPQNGLVSISTNVIRAFLLAGKYLHGARSLESIIAMSDLSHAGYFGPAHLPSPDLLSLHVTPDFQAHLHEAQLELPVIEALAAACHESFCREHAKRGYKWGPIRDDGAKTHPLLKPYEQLSEADKERNRGTARFTHAKLSSIGYLIKGAAAGGTAHAIDRLPPDQFEDLMRAEHDLWLREHLLQGYQRAENSQDALRLHRDIVPYNELPAAERALDALPIQNVVEILRAHGYVVVNKDG
jgi:RyR domain/ATPase family associated with various cellular activities (AAA)